MKRGLLKGVIIFVVVLVFYPIVKSGYELRGNNMKSKIWLHRANTIEKFKYFEEEYDNFEVDVIFRNDNRLEVTHDHDDHSGLYLEEYFKEIQNKKTNLWIDLKNINDENKSQVCKKLDEICSDYSIDKKRLIIETRDWQALSYLTDNEFYTSWYLDFDSGEIDAEDSERLSSLIKEVSSNNSVKAISFYGGNYPYINDLALENIDLLSWEHRKQKEMLPFFGRTRSMIYDDKVKVILVKDN